MPVRAADLETRLYATDREYNRTLADGERRAERYVSNVNRTFSRVGQVGGGLTSGGIIPGLAQISQIIQGIPQIGNLAHALIDPLKGATEEGIRFNMMVESAEVGFVGVARGIENARKHVASLRQFGEDSPLFNSEGLIRTSRLMNVFGFELSEHIPKIKIWGDAIASSGEMSEETLLGVARAFGQIRSLGRVNAEEMNQLAERGIPAWELLAKAIGKTVAETRKLGEQGRLRGGAAVEAITAQIAQDPRFKGTGERLAGTLQGRLARVGEIRERATGIATEGLTQDISTALSAALSQEDLAVTMAGGIKTAIAPVSSLIKSAIVTTVGGGITGGFEEAFNAAKAVLPLTVTDLVNTGILAPMFKAAGVQSPSTKTRYIGLMLAAGLQEGLAEGLNVRMFSDEIEKLIEEAAARFGLDPNLLRAMMKQESGGRKGAVSHKGASGLMQLMPATAARFGVTDIFNPRQNIMGGAAYVRWLSDRFGGDLPKVLAGYNAGEGAVDKYKGVPPYRETQNYVKSITAMYGRLGGGRPFSSLTAGEQLQLLWRIPEFRAMYGKMTGAGGGDLTGGTGVLASGGMVDFPFAKTPGFALNATQAVSTLSSGLRDAKEIQFDLLKAMGETGQAAEQGFGQAEQAVEDWYAKVVDSGNKAKTVFGITARDAAGAFEDAWVNTFTQTDLNFKSMASSFVLTFAQSINQMVQQWASAQISAGLGKLLSFGIGAITGGFGGVHKGGHDIGLGTPWGGPAFATGGSFTVGGPGGTDKTPVSFLATKGERVTVETPAQARSRGATVINNHVTNIIYSPRTVPSSIQSRRSSRENFEALLSMVR